MIFRRPKQLWCDGLLATTRPEPTVAPRSASGVTPPYDHDALQRRRETQIWLAQLAADRKEVPADKIEDLVDWFKVLLETGHSLGEAIDGVYFYALGTYGSME